MLKQFVPFLRATGAVLLTLVLMLVMVGPIGHYISTPGPATPWWAWVIAVLWYPVMIAVGLLFYRWVDRRPFSTFPAGFDRQARQAALWGSVLSLALLLGFIGLTQASGLATWHLNTSFHPTSLIMITVLLASAGPGEEIFYRGYVLRTMESYGPTVAALLSSLLFTLVHVVSGRTSPVELLAIFGHSLFYVVLTQRSKSIWPAVIIHGVYDGLSSLLWSGNAAYSLLVYEGSFGWIKYAYKLLMILPFFALVWAVYGRPVYRKITETAH